MDEKTPCLILERHSIFTGLRFRAVEIHVDFSFKRRSTPFAERKCEDIGGVIVSEEASIDAPDEPASHEDNRHLE